MKHPKVIAITGGIGSGQSSVSRLLGEHPECLVIHADDIARQIVDTNPTVKQQIKEQFGAHFFDKGDILKRKEFAKAVFVDKNHTQRLNQIVHPELVKELIDEVENAQDSGQYELIIIDAALIYEMAIERYFDAVVVVYAPKQERIKRVMERDQLSKQLIMDRMENQFDLNEKRGWADFVVDNSGNFEQLRTNVDSLFGKLKRL